MLSVVDNPYNKSFTIIVDGTKNEVGWGNHSTKSIQCVKRYIEEIAKLFPEYKIVEHGVKEDLFRFLTVLHGEGTEDEAVSKDFWSKVIDDPSSQVGSILASFMHKSGRL